MLIAAQRILTFSGSTNGEAADDLRATIDDLPLEAQIISVATACTDDAISGIAVVELIREAEAEPALDQSNVVELPVRDSLAESI